MEASQQVLGQLDPVDPGDHLPVADQRVQGSHRFVARVAGGDTPDVVGVGGEAATRTSARDRSIVPRRRARTPAPNGAVEPGGGVGRHGADKLALTAWEDVDHLGTATACG